MTTRVNVRQFKKWAREVAPAARAVLMARVFAEMERERVDGYIAPILASYRFRADDGTIIADAGRLYRAGDADEALLAAFYADCDDAHRAHGFTGPKGHCPALIAEHLSCRVESALIDLARPLFEVENWQLHGDNRAKYLDLLIGACVKTEHEARP